MRVRLARLTVQIGVGFPVLRTVRIVVFVLQDFAGESGLHFEPGVEFGERDVEFLRERQQLVAMVSERRADLA